MKLLEIDPAYRNYLIFKHALRLDASGDEMLAGLTAIESTEYVAIMGEIGVGAILKIGKDPERFLTLYDQHTAALLHLPSVLSSILPSAW